MKTFFFLCAAVACAAAAPTIQLQRTDGSICAFENHGSIKSTCDISYKGNSIASLGKRISSVESETSTSAKTIWSNLNALNDRILALEAVPAPTPKPTPAPTKPDTPHPCADGSHGCDKTIYGECFEAANGSDSYHCGCKKGYWSIKPHNPPHTAHQCARITPSPTPFPTPAPTPAPTPRCIDNKSFFVAAKNDCQACADNCLTGQYRFGCGHFSSGRCVACNTPKQNANSQLRTLRTINALFASSEPNTRSCKTNHCAELGIHPNRFTKQIVRSSR